MNDQGIEATSPGTTPPKETVFRWIARVGGLAACAFFGLMGFGEVGGELSRGTVEGVPILMMITLAIVGYLLSWRSESHGGALMLASGTMLGLTVAISGLARTGSPDLAIALLFFVCLGLPGLLYLLASRGAASR